MGQGPDSTTSVNVLSIRSWIRQGKTQEPRQVALVLVVLWAFFMSLGSSGMV